MFESYVIRPNCESVSFIRFLLVWYFRNYTQERVCRASVFQRNWNLIFKGDIAIKVRAAGF